MEGSFARADQAGSDAPRAVEPRPGAGPLDGPIAEPAEGRAAGAESNVRTEAQREGEGAEARPGIRQVVVRFLIVAFLVALDLWSKAYVFEWLTTIRHELSIGPYGHRRMVLVEPWFAFMLSRNAGAAFGRLDSYPNLLVGGRVLAVLFLIWLLARSSPLRRWNTAALALVLAGAMGNLHDNLFLEAPAGRSWGEVRDFIDVYFPFIGERGWHFPTFNVADSCITVGAILLLVGGLFGSGHDQEPARAD